MLHNYLKVIIRNFIMDRMYTGINVLGLVLGLASCLIIAQYVYFEVSFDKEVKNKDRIYYSYLKGENSSWESGLQCHPAVRQFLIQSIPEVESAVRFFRIGGMDGDPIMHKIGSSDKYYSKVTDVYFADANVLDFFSITLLQGDEKTALAEPNSIVITKSVADKFFPDGKALDQLLGAPNARDYFRITGVCADPPRNNSIKFNALISFVTINGDGELDQLWMYPEFQTFVRMHGDVDLDMLENKINESLPATFKEIGERLKFKQFIKLVPFSDYHFFKPQNTIAKTPVRFTGDKKLIKFMVIIAALILAVSWANYISLTTARAIRRAKEVGLRKINGAGRKNLVTQFLIEFLSLNFISMLMAITLAQILFPVFAAAIGSQAQWMFWTETSFWLSALLFLFVSTLTAGIYPAFFMSRYQPSTVLKGNFATSTKGSALRTGLVFAQFTFSVCLLVTIYVIERQLNFLQTKELGISTDQVLSINMFEIDSTRFATGHQRMKSALGNLTSVKHVSAAGYYPGSQTLRNQFFYRKSDSEKRQANIRTNQVTAGYMETMEIALLYGRDFKEDPELDSDKVIINEKAAQELGFADAQSAVGEWIVYDKIRYTEFQIIGVVKDFNESTKTQIVSDMFFKGFVDSATYGYFFLLVKLSTEDIAGTLGQIEATWYKQFPNAAFDYFFLDDHFDKFYKEERQFAGIFRFFSFVGVVITCMGLFGLSAYNTSSRSKEIGIRKSVGASVKSIMWLFSKEYFKLALLSSAVGIPFGIWMLNNWLKNYPNRIGIEADLIIVPFVMTLFIALATIGYQTFSTARANPVESLRGD